MRAREVIGEAVAASQSVATRGDTHALAAEIIAALDAGGYVILLRETTPEMVAAALDHLPQDGVGARHARAAVTAAISAAKEQT